jgi:trans-aconitate methyltransferase
MRFEFDGEKYARASAHQKEWGSRLIEEFSLGGDERILDLGCGDGALTARLAELVPEGLAVGIDASAGMIESASKHAAPNLRFELMNIDDLDFEDEFDIIFSNATLHWVKDHRRLLGNVHRALRPGGLVRLNFAADGNCVQFFEIIRDAMARPAYARHFDDFEWPWYMPPLEEYRRVLDESPFETARVWGENADRYFPDADALAGWIDQPSIVPFLARIPEAEKADFRTAVVERSLERTRQPDGTYFVAFRRINVAAEK